MWFFTFNGRTTPQVPHRKVEGVARRAGGGVLHESQREVSTLSLAANDVSPAAQPCWHPRHTRPAGTVAAFFPTHVRSDETHALVSAEKESGGAAAAPGRLSRPPGTRKHLLVSEQHSRTAPGRWRTL